MIQKYGERKVVAVTTIIALGAVHLFLMSKGQKVPGAVDQALIAALGVLFAPKKDAADAKD